MTIGVSRMWKAPFQAAIARHVAPCAASCETSLISGLSARCETGIAWLNVSINNNAAAWHDATAGSNGFLSFNLKHYPPGLVARLAQLLAVPGMPFPLECGDTRLVVCPDQAPA
ncbi:MAG: hypothetical protein ACJ8AI_02890 [Rhodopila sp.]